MKNITTEEIDLVHKKFYELVQHYTSFENCELDSLASEVVCFVYYLDFQYRNRDIQYSPDDENMLKLMNELNVYCQNSESTINETIESILNLSIPYEEKLLKLKLLASKI